MSYQVDYIPVGNGASCGDAIAVRYWDPQYPESQKVFVIDGGTLESGRALVDHIKNHFGTEKVDYIFSTHLDNDHLSGLRPVLEDLQVGTLYMHLPWEHASETSDLYKGSLTASQLESKLQKSLEKVVELQELAIENGVAVEELFAGQNVDENILVLGPSREYYGSLTSQFRDTPPARSALIETLTRVREQVGEAVPQWIYDGLGVDLLGEGGETSAENNSSLILLISFDNHKLLFTGDAGVPALSSAVDFAESKGIPLSDLHFLHVPHHGSKRNLSTPLLERINAGAAIISASLACTDHPSKRITNALHKIGTHVNSTEGKHLLQSHEAPRAGWNPIDPLPFYERFEE